MPEIKTWDHKRKGRITGYIVAESGEWVDIQLTEDHKLRYASMSNRGTDDWEGEILTARKSLLTEVDE